MRSFRPKRRDSFKTAVNKISKQLFKELESSEDESGSSTFPGRNSVDRKSKSKKTLGDVRLCEHEIDDEEDVLCELIDSDHVDGNFKAFVCMNSRVLTGKKFKDRSVTYFRGAAQHTISQSAVDGEDPDSHNGSSAHESDKSFAWLRNLSCMCLHRYYWSIDHHHLRFDERDSNYERDYDDTFSTHYF